MLGDVVGHQLLQQVEVHRVAGLGAAGGCGSLQEGPCGVSLGWPVQPPLGGPRPWARPYPLVNELELEVAPASVWVGLGTGLQAVPLILPAAQVLAAAVRGHHTHQRAGTGRRQDADLEPRP